MQINQTEQRYNNLLYKTIFLLINEAYSIDDIIKLTGITKEELEKCGIRIAKE